MRTRRPVHAIDATRVHLTMTWVVSFFILSRFAITVSTQRRSIMRRQKMKMGTCSALRKIAFTVGKEETDQFQKQQDELAEHSLGCAHAPCCRDARRRLARPVGRGMRAPLLSPAVH